MAVACLFSAQTYPCQDRHTDGLLQTSRSAPDKDRDMVLASPAMFPGYRRWYHKIHFPVERGGLTLHEHTRQGGNRGGTTCPESQTVEETRHSAVLTSSKAAGHRINPEAHQTQVKKTQHTTAAMLGPRPSSKKDADSHEHLGWWKMDQRGHGSGNKQGSSLFNKHGSRGQETEWGRHS